MDVDLVNALLALDSKVLGERIKAARAAKGLTQPDLGGSDASVAYVSRIEKGERRPGPELVDLFAQRLGVNVEQLVLGEIPDHVRALELQIDLAELELGGGQADVSHERVLAVLADVSLDRIPGGRLRARYVCAAAAEALGLPEATDEFASIVAEAEPGPIALKAAVALSRVSRERGALDEAVSAAERGLDIARKASLIDTEQAVRLTVTLAAAHYERGDIDTAAAACEEAIERADRLDAPGARAAAYWNTSVIEAEAGNIERALHLAKKALNLLETAEGTLDLARLRTQLSAIMLRVDPPDIDDARRQLEQASKELEWSGASPADRARTDIVRARLLFVSGALVEAHELAQEAVGRVGPELPLARGAGLSLLGQIAWSLGDDDGARQAYRSAIAVLTGFGNDREAAQLWFEVGALADEAGLHDEARDAYKRAAASSGLAVRNPIVRGARPVPAKASGAGSSS
ncbi:tetratricopeptide (TPR) repeat protein [Nocardioides thalensis]|uniref:Tetratricopeptide (TPR) repeat protein n=1 Tax=Nocardioides thalensis TaxID=1914755 RepID=A0A853BX05_9ACTN|nr:helix-turn-helix domain-containing protein [Nocardioides thalensis]NYI99603.1 tetratricopeptide (TPR) repeat protein [Nocardioides thalensis]